MSKASKRIPRRFIASYTDPNLRGWFIDHVLRRVTLLEVTPKSADYICKKLNFKSYSLKFDKNGFFRECRFYTDVKSTSWYTVHRNDLIGIDNDDGSVDIHNYPLRDPKYWSYKEVPRHVK